MYKNTKVYAVVTAAGSGKRMGANKPKQFLAIDNKPILYMTMEKFCKEEAVDKIVVTAPYEYKNQVREIVESLSFYNKPISIVRGGKERQDSVFNALNSLSEEAEDDDIIMIHDGVRPYVTSRIIKDVLETIYSKGNCVVAVPVKDTIRDIELGTLERGKLYSVQTPQGAYYKTLLRAYKKAYEDYFQGTDEGGLIEHYGLRVNTVKGDYNNIKITTKEDLPVSYRIGTGYDVHRLVEDRPLILGGVKIPYEKGLDGHSDADVLVHALMDAMLGAAGLRDIGFHFPDTDSRYKGISSLELLREVVNIIGQSGYNLVNCDITVICQNPKLSAFIPTMKRNVAQILGAMENDVNIKATTTEKLGFEGEGLGIAAEAVALLSR